MSVERDILRLAKDLTAGTQLEWEYDTVGAIKDGFYLKAYIRMGDPLHPGSLSQKDYDRFQKIAEDDIKKDLRRRVDRLVNKYGREVSESGVSLDLHRYTVILRAYFRLKTQRDMFDLANELEKEFK